MSRLQNFEDVIEELKYRLRDYMHDQGINTKGNFNCPHPEHQDTVASAGLVPASDFTKWKCFGCGERGDIFDLVHYLEDKPESGPAYIEETVIPLAERFGIDVKLREPTEEELFIIDSFRAYKAAADYISSNLSDLAKQEIEKREWDEESAKSRLIGSVDSFENYKMHMENHFPINFLQSIDLLKRDLFNENNLIFTVCDSHGRPCGFGARNLRHDPDNRESIKYINTSARNQIYEKSKRLYDIHIAKKESSPTYIMEGYTDVETAMQQGMKNSTCVGGTAFTEHHIVELSRLGKTDVVLAMDGDKAGHNSVNAILKSFTAHRQFTIHVISIPENLDPDGYIRKYGVERFKKLRHWTAFEWTLSLYDDRIDSALIRKEVVPIIASQWSPIEREKMAKVLSDKIGVSVNAIIDEVSQILNEKEAKKAQEQESVISSLISDLKQNPRDWRLSMNSAMQNLENLSSDYNEETFSSAAYLKELNLIEEDEEQSEETETFFHLENMKEFSEAVRGDWRECLNVIGGGANTGKTAFMANLALAIAQIDDFPEEESPLVLFHTIDDTVRQFTTRLACQFATELMPHITLNMIKRPNAYPQTKMINEARRYAYSKLKELVATNRIVVKGGEEGGGANLSFGRDLISHYRKLYPKRRMQYFVDNFHRLRDFSHISDERLRFKKLSTASKDIAKEFDMTVWATMEYNKSGSWEGRPTNNSISESIAMEYDANLICHVYNDLHTKRDDAEIFFKRTDDEGREYKAPRVELIFGKNKISDYKGTLYFDFYTEQSRYQAVPRSVVNEDINRAREARKQDKQGARRTY